MPSAALTSNQRPRNMRAIEPRSFDLSHDNERVLLRTELDNFSSELVTLFESRQSLREFAHALTRSRSAVIHTRSKIHSPKHEDLVPRRDDA